MSVIRDPILRWLAPRAEPSRRKLLKDDPSAASGGPVAGRITIGDARRQGVAGLLQILGPGLVTGASDDDPSGIGTYSQVGSQFGLGMLWMALFTLPLMTAVQEMCSRVALQTGVGLGVSLRRRFPTALVGVLILAMLVANTVNLGADLAAVAAGGQLLSRGRMPAIWLVVPVAALILGLQVFAAYGIIFRLFKWLTLALFAYVIAAFFAHPDVASVIRATVVPHVEWSADFVMAMVAVLGTTISPYLFFWQASSEVEEMPAAGRPRQGVRRAELRAARVDVAVGMFFSQAIMYFIILVAGSVLHRPGAGVIQTADQAAGALAPVAGPFAFVLFAAGLIGTGLLAIPILSGSAAYAVKEFTGMPGGLAAKPRYRPTFYLVIAAATVAGVMMNLFRLDPIRALFLSAVVNGVVAPPLLVLITILAGDESVMGRRRSGRLSRWLCWTASAAMSVSAVAMLFLLVRH